MNKRKKFLSGLFLGIILFTGICCTAVSAYADEVKSKGRLEYTDRLSKDIIVVDSNDFRYLRKQLEEINTLMGR